MGYMKEEKLIGFLRYLKKNLIAYEDKHGDEFDVYFDDSWVRYSSKIANLQSMVFICEEPETAFETADCSLEEFCDDTYVDVYISCEGNIYEYVYGYSAYGGDARKKDLYDAFVDAADNNELTMDFCGGAFSFQSKKSWDKQNEDEKIERERMEDEFRSWKEEI